jgi:hypothetical protein
MKISRNFTLVLFLGAIASIFFGIVMMRDQSRTNRPYIYNWPFILSVFPQLAPSRKATNEELLMMQQIRFWKSLPTPPYVPVSSVEAPTGSAAVLPSDLVSKLTVRVPFVARYHVVNSSKYSMTRYTIQPNGSFQPHSKEDTRKYEGFCGFDGNRFIVKEDGAADNTHYVYLMDQKIAFRREQNGAHNSTTTVGIRYPHLVRPFVIDSSTNLPSTNYVIFDYPSFWPTPYFPFSPKTRTIKQNGKYIFTTLDWENGETDYTFELVNDAPRLSSIVKRMRLFDNGAWYVDKKEVFSNFIKAGSTWLPKSILITTNSLSAIPQKNVTFKSPQKSEKDFRYSLMGVDKTQISIDNINMTKPSSNYFDWRRYAVNGEVARNTIEGEYNNEHFIINTSTPDLLAQADANHKQFMRDKYQHELDSARYAAKHPRINIDVMSIMMKKNGTTIHRHHI